MHFFYFWKKRIISTKCKATTTEEPPMAQTGNIELNEERLKYLERVLASSLADCNNEDKSKALLGVFMLIIHELGHYGDMLDGLQQEIETGVKIEWDVWWENHKKYPYTTTTDKFDSDTQKEIIDEKKGSGVLPNLPEHPGSAGPADGSAGPANSKNKRIKG